MVATGSRSDAVSMIVPTLFDERDPAGFRTRFRHEIQRSRRLDVAVTRLRLSTIDITEAEFQGVTGMRLVLSELRAEALDAEAHALMARPRVRGRLARFQALLDQERIRIRVAPLGGWSPDYTVFHDAAGPRSVLLGYHQFERPHPYPGPALCAHFGRPEALLAHRRFQEIWLRAHDVLPAVHSILSRAGRWADEPRTVDTLPALG